MCDFALGSDTGGSVRAPANHCGLVGMRPSHGRISLEDTLALSPSLDTCGWFTRDVPTFARVADVLLGEDTQALPDSVRLLVPNDIWGLAAPAAVKALKPVRGQIEECLGKARTVNVVLDDFDTMFWHFRAIQGREAWDVDGAFIQRFAPVLGPGVAERFQWSSELSDATVASAQEFRQRWRAHIGRILGTDGVLLMPTMPDVAPLITASEADLDVYRNRATRMLCGAGLAGLPQLSLPLAQRQGAPLGISLVGPVGSDRSLVRLAERIHAALS
jgi:amidase